MPHDLLIAAGWALVLAAGLGFCVLAHARGLSVTSVRDLLHVGVAVWVLGWPLWEGRTLPCLIPALALLFVLAVPRLAPRLPLLARLKGSISGGDERWTGIVLYVLAYAIGTPLGLLLNPFPAAAALLALSLGDGVGGAVGRALGRRRYRVGRSKTKTLEGTFAVLLAAWVGVLLASIWFESPRPAGTLVLLALAAALAEGAAPRATDNLAVPLAVYALAGLL